MPGTLTISQAGTSAGLSGSASTSVVGQAVTFSVQVAPVGPGAGQPTGTVTFVVDGNPVATSAVNPATGQASFSTASLGHGPHTITATYAGDSDFVSSQTGSVQETVAAAGTESGLTALAIRNRRGKITGVELVTQVSVVPPGGGVPTGAVTYFRKARRIPSVALSGGRAELTLKVNQALKKPLTVQYGGDANFSASTSAPVVLTAQVPEDIGVTADRVLSAGRSVHRRALRGCPWPHGGLIGIHAAAPCSLLNNCHPRPVNAYLPFMITAFSEEDRSLFRRGVDAGGEPVGLL